MKSRLLATLGVIMLMHDVAASWLDREEFKYRLDPLYTETRDPFRTQGEIDLSDIDIGRHGPIILSWGDQRNFARDLSDGLFSDALSLGLGDIPRTSSNYTPRLMPFGGPLSYAQGRDFTFTLDHSEVFDVSEEAFLDYYNFSVPLENTEGEASFSYGEFGSMTSEITASIPAEKLEMIVGLSWKEFGDFKDGSDIFLTDSLDLENPKVKYIDEAKNRDIYRIREIRTTGKYDFSPTQYLEFNGRYQDAQDVYFPELRMDAAYDRGSNVSATYHVLNPSPSIQKISFQAFTSNAQQELNDRWRQTKITNLEDPGIEDYSTRARSNSYTQGFDFKAIKDYSDVQIGFGMRRYWQSWDADSETLGVVSQMLPQINQSNFGAYLEGQRYFGNFKLSGAIRIDQLDTEVDGNLSTIRQYRPEVSRRIQDSALSVSARIIYDIADSAQVYAELGHAVRVPDPNEMFVQYEHERAPGNTLLWLGNPNLESVKNTCLDVGFDVQLKRFKFRVKAFYATVQDLIYLENVTTQVDSLGPTFLGTAFSYNNVDAQLYGGDAALEIRILDSFKLKGGFEFVRGRKTELDGLSGDEDLAEMPPLRAKVALEYDNQLWFSKVEMQIAEAQLEVDESISESPLDGYTVFNFLVGYYFTDNFLMTLGVENITNQAYSSNNVNIRNPFSNYGVSNEPGRFIYLSLKWGF